MAEVLQGKWSTKHVLESVLHKVLLHVFAANTGSTNTRMCTFVAQKKLMQSSSDTLVNLSIDTINDEWPV